VEITGKTVDAIQLPAGRAEIIAYDGKIPGFGIRIRAGGSRTRIYTYKFAGKTRRLTLGAAVKEAFPNIRQRVLELQAQVRLGQDPAAVKEAAVAAAKQQQAESFRAIVDLYLAKQLKTARPSTYKEESRYLLDKASSFTRCR
jgi:Arm DNA-binding domain